MLHNDSPPLRNSDHAAVSVSVSLHSLVYSHAVWDGLHDHLISLPRNFALKTVGKLLIVISIKVNLLYLFHSAAMRCCFPHLIKQNCLLKTFKTPNLDDSGISLPVFLSRTNLKLHYISVTPKFV